MAQILFISLFLWVCSNAFAAAGAVDSFQLHPDLEIALYVKEPDVVDPVALTWDENGRIYVVEMRDYPYGFGPERKPGGTVRLLEDRDGDGRIDSSVVFAEGLSFPTSIAPWNGGVLVSAPPEIIFLKDVDGDGKAEVREVILKGFILGVTDSNVNGLRWGVDNRIHGLNGGNGGSITSPRKPGEPVSIRGLDFRLDPATGEVTPTYHTSAGFGLVFDEWGRRFVTYNINHIQHQTVPARYLLRFPGLPPMEAVESISDHGDMARIYPVSIPETRVNHPEQSGHFSSAGGMGYIAWNGYGRELLGSVLVCDVVGNLVHRDVLSKHGPGFVARRSPLEKQSEFLASRDLAFRPVGIESGPDGALYLIDMQRDVIEHPDYIPEKVLKNLDIRAGADRGRIYRITPRKGLPPRKANLGHASTGELVKHLSDANPWWRQTAQRLLVERADRTAISSLTSLARGKNPFGQLHALWTLQGLRALQEGVLRQALQDGQKEIRENALSLAEPFLPHSAKLQEIVLRMVSDSDARVRFQAALSIGEFEHSRSAEALLQILLRDHEWRWSRLAALSSLRSNEVQVLSSLLNKVGFRREITPAKLTLIRELTDLLAARSATRSGEDLAKALQILENSHVAPAWQEAALEGLHTGVKRGGRPKTVSDFVTVLEKLAGKRELFVPAWKLSDALGLPRTAAQKQALANAGSQLTNAPLNPRIALAGIQVLAMGTYSESGTNLLSCLTAKTPSNVQQQALAVLSAFSDADVAHGIIQRWRTLAPSVRPTALNLLLQRVPFHEALLDAVEQGHIQIGELNLDLEQRRRLMRESTPEIQARARKWIGDEEYSNRKALVEDWLGKLPPSGNADNGRVVFQKLCAQCHQADKTGFAVGPDIRTLAHRSVEDLVSNILDPNMAINPAYVSYTVETVGGEIETGILGAESHEAITLLQAEGKKRTIPRSELKRFQSSGTSLMPEGVESGMSPAELRDLIAFIHQRK